MCMYYVRVNKYFVFIKWLGIFYDQCAEISGILHCLSLCLNLYV
jgi:hypothetical protein